MLAGVNVNYDAAHCACYSRTETREHCARRYLGKTVPLLKMKEDRDSGDPSLPQHIMLSMQELSVWITPGTACWQGWSVLVKKPSLCTFSPVSAPGNWRQSGWRLFLPCDRWMEPELPHALFMIRKWCGLEILKTFRLKASLVAFIRAGLHFEIFF